MIDGYIGVDVAFAKGRRLPVCISYWSNGRLVPAPLRSLPIEPPRGSGNLATLDPQAVGRFAEDARDYIVEACRAFDLAPKRLALDAPSSPRPEDTPRRAAETAMDRAGISCFTTPSAADFTRIHARVRSHLAMGGAENRLPHANQLWMQVGFALFKELGTLAPCIEVFPQATARVLDAGSIHKFKTGGVEAQLLAAARHTGWPSAEAAVSFEDIGFGPAHDRLDAYLSAWVAALPESDRIAFGSPPHDVIWAPRVEDYRFERPPPTPRRQAPRPRPQHATRHERECPACADHIFRRWPFGWDSHGAHRCSGLQAGSVEQRKTEFKERFGHLFRRKTRATSHNA